VLDLSGGVVRLARGAERGVEQVMRREGRTC
jgi:hypothetical protein